MMRSFDAPVLVEGVTDAVAVACGGLHCCAQTSVGAVLCWGSNATFALSSAVPYAMEYSPPTEAVMGACPPP